MEGASCPTMRTCCRSPPTRPAGETHRRYTQAVNRRQGWVGHRWQDPGAGALGDGTGGLTLEQGRGACR